MYFSKYLQIGSQWDSIEHSATWAKRGEYLLENFGNPNINVHFVPSNREYQEGGHDGDIETFRNYVLFPMQLNTQFQIIIVDGRARIECMKVGWYLLQENGVMVLHDAQRQEYKGSIPADSCYLHLVNTRINIEGNVTLLFICKRADTISKIKTSLEKRLPQHFRIDSNVDDFLVNEKLHEVSKSSIDGSNESNVEEDDFVPKVFTIETNLTCNLKCPECAIGGNLVNRAKGFMKFDQFRIIAEKIQPFVKLCYLFNWGEPLLNPDIFKIIDHAASNFDADIVISTNGLLLNEKTSQLLIDSGVSEVLVSIDGTTQEVYEKYRIGGNVEKALSSLMVLQETNLKRNDRVKITPQFIVFKHNQHEMRPFMEFCKSIGLSPFFKSPYIRNGSEFSDSDYPELRRKRYPDIQSLRHAMRGCRDPREVFTINMDGSVVVCCNDYDGTTVFGNIFRQSVKEIWNCEQSLKFRRAILRGNAPQFCIDNCMVYLPDQAKKSDENDGYNDIKKIIKSKKSGSLVEIGENGNLKNTGISKDEFKVLFITTYYESFIKSLYQRISSLCERGYEEQLSVLTKEFHGDSDFYSSAMNKAGLTSSDLITNCAPLQNAWAAENNFSGMGLAIAIEQIRRFNPQILYFHDMNLISKELLCAVRPYTKLIVGQIATPIFKDIPFSYYDIIFSSFPHYVKKFRRAGLTSYYQPLAFDPRILQASEPREYNRRKISCSFVGGISKLHLNSYQLLELLAKETPIVFWGYGANTLPVSSIITERHKGQAWGKEMFDILLSSQITINRHGEIAENYANNMRLYEATGTGTLLITDYKDNLNELFEIGKEIVAYRSPHECTSLVKYYLANPHEAEEIAKAGQVRTLRDHTYTKRMGQTAEILSRHLRYRKEEKLYSIPSEISHGHMAIKPGQVTEDMKTAWQSEEIPPRQRGLVQKELEEMYRNQPPQVYQILADCLRYISQPKGSILEIGCASGYYYEILEYLLNEKIVYTGVDYSIPLVSMAKDYYPNAKFYAADGAKLPFKDKKFFIAISSCVLLHVPNYREHIRETVRVAQKFVVAHRTPICRKRPTQHLRKFAYGVETVELIFNEEEIISEFELQGLKLVNANEYYANDQQDHYEVTYLFEKAGTYNASLIREKEQNKTFLLPPKNCALKMLNLGCGGRYHKDWINIDFNSSGPDVIKHNLCLGIPTPNEAFDVVYHSDLLEHFPKSYAPAFLKECWRVLKPGGIIRVAQPDLEEIVRLYLDALDRSLEGDTEAQRRYEWLVIELLDQMVRNRSGGEMVEYWRQTPMPAEEFVIERCGSEVLGALQYLRTNPKPINNNEDPYLNAIRNNDGSQIKKMSLFRMSGEVHQWMYDRYSLKKILGETGFVDIQQCCANQSEIPDFNSYLLDIEPNGNVRKPDSFFMEARKQP
ncbi:MAG: glycosyltransferase family protein [Nitrospinales bacterium]